MHVKLEKCVALLSVTAGHSNFFGVMTVQLFTYSQ